ncbi:MAG: TrkA family potassium uptake protein [Candidatus Ureaplasma intestinipullorum]|uniref:TrkA family potassium uptake protein n=1 Tax=Candidatus Ureaplasma intestinipullorum TaxID=2838770 RepID=A0A9E2NVU4_9BACT|nr:TrkA family potassium uptake protein [Candidatus Ureaplasma intestinipullorum]
MQKKEFCIIGVEGFTLQVANALRTAGFKVVLIDSDEDKIQALSNQFEYVFKADATNINALEEVNISEFSQVIVGVSSMEDSILIISNLRQLKVKNIVAKVRNEVQKRILNILTDRNIKIIWPEELVAEMTSFRLVHDIDLNISMFDEDVAIIKIPVQNPKLYQVEIKDFELKSQFLTNIIMIERGSEIIFPVRSSTKLLSDDIITIACKSGTIDKIVNLFTKK